jgi:hypothetical protein
MADRLLCGGERGGAALICRSGDAREVDTPMHLIAEDDEMELLESGSRRQTDNTPTTPSEANTAGSSLARHIA